MIVDGLDTTRTYSADEVIAMRDSGKLREVTMRGWLFRWEPLKGGMKMVHFTDPTANRQAPGSTGGRRLRAYTVEFDADQMRKDVERDHPIRKRTPQERLASMTNKLTQGERGQEAAAKMMMDMLQGAGSGNMDGLDDDAVKAITGASWKKGDPIDGDTVRRVAARYLGEAERRVAETARDTRTKAGRKARKEQERLEAQERQAGLRRKRALAANNENTREVF
jgi:hypothetical protein